MTDNLSSSGTIEKKRAKLRRLILSVLVVSSAFLVPIFSGSTPAFAYCSAGERVTEVTTTTNGVSTVTYECAADNACHATTTCQSRTVVQACDRNLDNDYCAPYQEPNPSECTNASWVLVESTNDCPECQGSYNINHKYVCGTAATCGGGCTQSSATDTQACTNGRTGNMTRTRTTNSGGVCGSNGSWSAFNESGCSCPSGQTWNGSSCVTVCTETATVDTQPCGSGRYGNMTRTQLEFQGNNCSAPTTYTSWDESACEPIAGCGGDAGGKFYADSPPGNLCSEGNPSEISGQFSWTCKVGEQTPVSCGAELKCRVSTESQSKSCATAGYMASPGSIVRSRPINIDEVCGTHGDWSTWDESSCRFPSSPVFPPAADCPIPSYSRPDLMAAFGPRHWERVIETGSIECVKNNKIVGPCNAIERRILTPQARSDDAQRQVESCVKDTSCMPRIDATCGSANESTVTAAPSSGLCATGTPTAVTGTGPWKWSCSVKNTATTVAGKAAACEAKVAPPAVVPKGGICEAP